MRKKATELARGALSVLGCAFALTAAAETTTWATLSITHDASQVYTAANGDLILIYTNAATATASEAHSLTLPTSIATRILAVGGGGAGGTIVSGTASIYNYTAGGGGGAGGFVDKSGLLLDAGTYSINVGVGGAAIAQDSECHQGNNGGDSFVKLSGTDIVRASGGGGGGAGGLVGRDGGSGGGGAHITNGGSGSDAGGQPKDSPAQGCAGGTGTTTKFAAGGGGAGSAGADASTAGKNTGGNGLPSNITDETVTYAGGGGGGRTGGDTNLGAGGSGGGGSGGGQSAGKVPTQGVDGLGGGGGGGGRRQPGARGGHGIIVVRLEVPMEPPECYDDLVFSGENQIAFDPANASANLNYDLSGTYCTNAVNAGSYSFRVQPKSGFTWKEGGSDWKTVNWSIASAVVEKPAAIEDVVFFGDYTNVISSTGYYTISGNYNERDVSASYVAVATLNNPGGVANCKWSDDSTDPYQIPWKIVKREVELPSSKTGLVYNGNPQIGVTDSADTAWYHWSTTAPSTTNETDASSEYVAVAVLNEPANLQWAGGTSADLELNWQIAKYAVAKPTAKTGLIFSGAAQNGVIDSSDAACYTVIGNIETNAGNHTATATLVSTTNYKWAEGDSTPLDVAWVIASKPVTNPTISSAAFEYDTTEKKVTIAPVNLGDYATVSGTTNATAVGEYQFTVTLKNPTGIENYVWSDDSSSTARTIDWAITAIRVTPPTVVTGLKYTSGWQYGIIDSADASLYTLTGENKGIVVRAYNATVAINDKENYVWADTLDAEDKELSFTIDKADNQITSLKLAGWKFGKPVNHPTVEATWGKTEVVYTYSDNEGGPWDTLCPTNVGAHYVRAVVPENVNYHGAEAKKKFAIWLNAEDNFRDYVDFYVKGYTGTEALANFPLLIRIDPSKQQWTGFDYQRAGIDGKELFFADENGDQYPYEVDTWNVEGESLLWVKIAALTNNAVVRMYWCPKEGVQAKDNYNPEEVWSEYAGVWHFNDDLAANGGVAFAPSTDSTGNGNAAWPVCYNSNSGTHKMASTSGSIGLARIIEDGQKSAGGCRLVVSNSTSLALGNTFTFSGWVNISIIDGDTGTSEDKRKCFPISHKERDNDSSGGWSASFVRNGTTSLDARKLQIYGNNTAQTSLEISSVPVPANGWSYFSLAFKATSVRAFGRNAGSATSTIHTGTIEAVTNNCLPYVFGNGSVTTNQFYESMCGSVDEYRLAKVNRSADWVLAEYQTAADVAFTTNSLIVKDGLKVNYWYNGAQPNFAPLQWQVDDVGMPTTCYLGVLAEGTPTVKYISIYDMSTNDVVPTANGSYRALFTMADQTGYWELTRFFNFSILGESPYNDPDGSKGANGRVLLMNRDDNPALMVERQSIADWHQYPTRTTFWQRLGYDSELGTYPEDTFTETFFNRQKGTEHILWTKNWGRRLWHLVDCRMGNLNLNATMAAYITIADLPDQAFFPWQSSTAYSYVNNTTKATTQQGGAQIIMRNTTDACVYSPYYEDGIGAIYFDALNAGIWKSDNATPNSFMLAVDICTNTIDDVMHPRGVKDVPFDYNQPPTDINIQHVVYTNLLDEAGEPTGEVEVIGTNNYDFAEWRTIGAILYKKDNTPDFVQSTVSGAFNLDITHGGTCSNLYRVVAPVKYRGPIRFRIRRHSKNAMTGTYGEIDAEYSQIILDNIIVSTPTMSAELKPAGWYDPQKKGKATLGQEIATTVPFPAVADSPVYGRAQPIYYVNNGTAADTNKFIQAANMHYRWRYLKQRSDPVASSLEPANPGYYNESNWKTIPLSTNPNDGFRTIEPLDYPARVGDLEFWYDLSLDTPFFRYVDFTGLDLGCPYDEKVTAGIVRMSIEEMAGAQQLASTGKDWFVRLREGKSNFEAVNLVVTGKIEQVISMELIEDNMWRGLLKIPEYEAEPDYRGRPVELTGDIWFSFEGINEQTVGSYVFATNKVMWGAKDGTKTTIPNNGELRENGTRLKITLDHNAGYYEFKVSDRFLTWGVSRAEYQSFNNWNDLYTPADTPSELRQKFRINSVTTNGVDDVAMKIYELKDSSSSWPAYNSHPNNRWDEPFSMEHSESYPKDTLFQFHSTPAQWDAKNITFVSQTLAGWDSTKLRPKDESGMAGKLLGMGRGEMTYVKQDWPEGLEKVTFKARVGQSTEFDTFYYSLNGFMKSSTGMAPPTFNSNYTFMCPVSMSHWVGTGTTTANNNILGDYMAVGASVSICAYYMPGVGCYEFRVSRIESGAVFKMELFRWSNENGAIQPTLLAAHRMGRAVWYRNTTSLADTAWLNVGDKNPCYYGFFISCENTGSGTKIHAGIANGNNLPLTATPNNTSGTPHPQYYNNRNYDGLIYTDNSTAKLTYGSYGVSAKDCAAQFLLPRLFDAPFDRVASGTGHANIWGDNGNANLFHDGGKGKRFENKNCKFASSDGLVHGEYLGTDYIKYGSGELGQLTEDLDKGWWTTSAASPMEVFTNQWNTTSRQWHHGLRMPGNLSQKVIVEMREQGSGENAPWTEIGQPVFTGYGFTEVTLPVHVTGNWNIRFRTGEKNIDIVLDDITQYQWQAPDQTGFSGVTTKYIYLQNMIETNLTSKFMTLQPSRGEPGNAMSLRSPRLAGIGRISFSYNKETCDDAAEIWVQVATNNVRDYARELDQSIREGTGPGEWQTVAKYGPSSGYNGKLKNGEGMYTIYLGYHDQADAPVEGYVRLFVPTNVIKTALANAYRTDAVNHGKVSVTGMTVTDEPGLSDRAWRGWNLRTLGNAVDSEKRMLLSDTTLEGSTGNGLVCAMNNSIVDVINEQNLDDKVKVKANYPTIWSPSFGRTTGYKSGVGTVIFKARLYDELKAKGGLITLYGSRNSIGDQWTKITEFEVTDSVFKQFSWSAGNESYLAIKLEISDPEARSADNLSNAKHDRVIIDEITICEKVQPSVGFLYAYPFRQHLMDPVVIEDISSPNEQPLSGESWGVQARVQLKQLADEIDTERGFRVFMSYYVGDEPWGYEQWKNSPGAVNMIELVQVGTASNLIFRSVGTSPTTLVAPIDKGGTFVQFQLTAKYRDRGGTEYDQTIESVEQWEQPDWFWPIDKNKENGGDIDMSKFSPYTVLDTVSPGRAWINEINFNDGSGAKNNQQFMEICVPSGVDMTGWYVRATDFNYRTYELGGFGDGKQLPAKKVSANATNGYEFVVMESPKTQLAGGVKNPLVDPVHPDRDVADGIWTKDVNGDGTLSYDEPYQFELIRPSGIVEHQFLIAGTNEYAGYSYEADYEPESLKAYLDAQDSSPKRFIVGHELEHRAGSATELGSSGVRYGNKEGEPAPGADGTWAAQLKFTPGTLNDGQTIPLGWFLAPNGTNCWVYFTVNGDHITQWVNGTNLANQVAVVPIGSTTSVVYQVANWYQANVDKDGEIVASFAGGEHELTIAPSNTMVYITANEGPDRRLADEWGLTEDEPYSQAVANWLGSKYPDSSVDDLRPAIWKALGDSSTEIPLSLVQMYWLDVPPVPANEAERATGGTNWWVRAGIVVPGIDHQLTRTIGGESVTFTNKRLVVQAFISNDVSHVVYAPTRMQGPANEMSDTFNGVWNGPTIKVKGAIDLSGAQNFAPLRIFTLGPDSFTAADCVSPGPFMSTIEVMDPFSSRTIGANYGWYLHPGTQFNFKLSIDTDQYQYSIEKLKADDTYSY